MGNAPTCVDCSNVVPRTIRFCDKLYFQRIKKMGRDFHKSRTGQKWMKINDNDYLCPECIKKRQQRETELEKKQNKKRQEELERSRENKRQKEEGKSDIHKLRIKEEMQKLDQYRRNCDRKLFSHIHEEKRTAHEIKDAKSGEIVLYGHNVKETNSLNNRNTSITVPVQNEALFNEDEICDSDEAIKKSLLSLRENLKWNKNDLDIIESNPFFRENRKEAVQVLQLLEIYAVKPDEIISYMDNSYASKLKRKLFTETPSEEMKVIDFLSRESTDMKNIIRGNFEQLVSRDIESIKMEMATQLSSDDLLRIEHIIKRYNDEKSTVRFPDIRSIRRSYIYPYNTCILENDRAVCEYIYVVSKAVKKAKDYWPNNVQILALICLIRSYKEGILLEIKTGEGKSCIVAMFAAFLCRSGLQEHVDIVSSSSVLACRDSVDWKKFYAYLDITVTHNLTKDDSNARQECYAHNVVYGSVGTFASDILREEFLLDITRSGRTFGTVIVDEVDCLLLDNGVQFTYLSHAVPGLHHLEPVILMIWNEVDSYNFIQSENSHIFAFGKLEPIHDVLSSCIEISGIDKQDQLEYFLQIFVTNGIITENISRKIFDEIIQGPTKFSEETSIFCQTFDIATMVKCLDCIDSHGNKLIAFRIDEKTNQLVRTNNFRNSDKAIRILVAGNGRLSFLYDSKKELIQLIEEKILGYLESENLCERYDIPKNLMPFLKNRLLEWIQNAFLAKRMQPGREYLITENEIVPIDFESTGVVEHGTKWGDCLHQFLEIKHSIQLSPISIVTNFLSNNAFFGKYKSIFGLSGTLGTDKEKEFIFKEFDLKCITIPTNLRPTFYEVTGYLCTNTEEWILDIQTILLSMKKQGRPVLVICEDINKTEMVSKSLPDNSFVSKIVYNRNDVENEDIQQFMKAEDVIIATNIAGRGTDLRIDDAAIQRGGLFVLVTFLPLNERVEKQIFGRTARKGQTGSAQIVIDRSTLAPEYARFGNLSDLRRRRDDINNSRLADYKIVLKQTVGNKERLFNSYCKNLRENAISNDESENKIYRNTMHEFWGFWLKAHFTPESNIVELEERLRRCFNDALQKTKSNDSPNSNIYHVIHIANEELEKENYHKAHTLFTKAIYLDEKWAAVAYYNRALCLIKQNRTLDVVNDLERAKERFDVFKEETVLCIGLIQASKRMSTDSNEPGSIMQQMQARMDILGFLDENIKNTLLKIKEIQISKKEIELDTMSPFNLAFGNILNKRLKDELNLFWEMGLLEIIGLHEKAPFSWKGLVVTVVGLVQISVGAMIISSTQGILLNLGHQLIKEGINDMCTGIHAMITNDNTFIKSWAISKAAGIAISFATFGLNACKSRQAIKATFSHIKNEAKAIMKFNVNRAVKETFRATCRSVAVHTTKEISQRSGRYIIDLSKTKLKEIFERRARTEVKKHVQKAFKQTIGKVVRHLISFYLNKSEQSKDIRKVFQKHLDSMSNAQMTQIGPALCGSVKNVVMTIKNDCNDGFSKDCFEMCELFDSLKYETADISELVNGCLTQLETSITKLHGDNLEESCKEEDAQYSAEHDKLFNDVETDTVEKIFSFMTESFEKTGNSLISDKLADSLHGLAKAVSTGKRGDIFSSTFDIAGNLVENFADEKIQSAFKFSRHVSEVIQNADTKNLMCLAFEVAVDAVDTFADEETKKKLRFKSKWASLAKDVFQCGKRDEIISFAIAMAEDAVKHFADHKIQKIVLFGLKWAKQATDSFEKDGQESFMSMAFDIIENAIETFSEGQTQKMFLFIFKWTKKAKETLKKGVKDEIIPFSIALAGDAIDIFANGQTFKMLKFGLKWTKIAHAVKEWDREKMMCLAMELTEDVIDAFVSERTKQTINRCLKCVKQARENMKSFVKMPTISPILKIASDTVNIFVEGQTHQALSFGLKWLNEVNKDITNWKKERMISLAIDLSKDAIDTFTCGKTQMLFQFGLKWITLAADVSNLQKKEQIMPFVFNVVEDAVSLFLSEETQRIMNFALKWAKQGTEITKNEGEQLISLFLCMAEDGIKNYADQQTKSVLTFALKWAKQGLKTFNTETEDITSMAENIVKDAINTFSADLTQKVLFFVWKWAKSLNEAVKYHGKKILMWTINMASDAAYTFTEGQTQKSLLVGLKWVNIAMEKTENGKSARKAFLSKKLANDVIGIVPDGQTKKALSLALKWADAATEAINSRDLVQVFTTIILIAENATDIFLDGEKRDKMNVALKWTKQAVKCIKSDRIELMITPAFDITVEAIDVFVRGQTGDSMKVVLELLKKVTMGFMFGTKEQMKRVAFDTAINAVEYFTKGDTRKTLLFGLKWSGKLVEAMQKCKQEEIMTLVTSIIDNALETFADIQTKEILKPGVKWAKQALDAIKSEKKEEMVSTAIGIADYFVDNFTDEQTRKTYKIVLEWTKQVIEAMRSNRIEEIVSRIIDIAEEAIKMFVGGQTSEIFKIGLKFVKKATQGIPCWTKDQLKNEAFEMAKYAVNLLTFGKTRKTLMFGLKWSKQVTETLNYSREGELLSLVIAILDDAIDTFVIGKTQTNLKLGLQWTKKAIEAFRSEEKEQIWTTAIDIVEDFVTIFINGKTRTMIKVGLKWIKELTESIKSNTTDHVMSTAIHIAEDAITTFTDGQTRKILKVVLKFFKRSTKVTAFQKRDLMKHIAFDIAECAVHTFSDGKIRKSLQFFLKWSKKAVETFQHFRKGDVTSLVIAIADDALERFANEETKLSLLFNIKLIKQATEVIRSEGTDQFESFYSDDEQDIHCQGLSCKTVVFLLKWAEQVIEAFKREKSDKSISSVIEAENLMYTFANDLKTLYTGYDCAEQLTKFIEERENPMKSFADSKETHTREMCKDGQFQTIYHKWAIKSLEVIKSGTKKEIFCLAFDIMEDLVDTFTQGRTKKTLKLGLKFDRIAFKGNQKTEHIQMMSLALDIAEDSVDLIANGKTKDTMRFASKWAKQAIYVIQNRSIKEIIQLVITIAEHSVQSLGNEQIQRKLILGLKWVKKATKTLEDGRIEQMSRLATGIIEDILNYFSVEQSKQESDNKTLLKFVDTWGNQAIEVIKKGKEQDIVHLSIDIAEDAINTFCDETTRRTFLFGMKWVREIGNIVLKRKEHTNANKDEKRDKSADGTIQTSDVLGLEKIVQPVGAFEHFMKTGITSLLPEIAEDAIKTFTEGETQKVLLFALESANHAKTTIDKDDKGQIITLASSIAEDALTNFTEGHTQKVLKFALKWTKQAIETFINREKEQLNNLVVHIAGDAVDTFASGKTQAKLKEGLKYTIALKKGIKPADKLRMISIIIGIANDAVNSFTVGHTKTILMFSLKWAKEATKTNFGIEEIMSFGTAIAHDAIKTFTEGQTLIRLNYGLRWVEHGVEAIKTGKLEQLVSMIIDLAEDTIATSASPQTNEMLKFGSKWVKQVTKAVLEREHMTSKECDDIGSIGNEYSLSKALKLSKKTEQMAYLLFDLAEDVADTFTDGQIKRTFRFALRWAKQSIIKYEKEQTTSLAFDMAHDALGTFTNGQTQTTMKFVLKWVKQMTKTSTPLEKEHVLDLVAAMAADAVETFDDEQIQFKLRLGLKLIKKVTAATKSGKVESMISLAIALAEDVVDDLTKGQIQKTLWFGLKWAKRTIEEIMKLEKNQLFLLAIDIAEDAVETFANKRTKKISLFVSKWAKQSFETILIKEKGKMMDVAFAIADNAVDTFSDENSKQLFKFALKWTGRALKDNVAGTKEQMIDLAIAIVEDAVDNFAKGQSQMKLKMGLKWAKKVSKAMKSEANEHIIFLAIDFAKDVIDTLDDERTKMTLKFGLKWAKQTLESVFKDGKVANLNLVLDIIDDALDTFADEYTQNILKFGLKWAKKATEDTIKWEKEEIIDLAILIAEDAVDRFSENQTQTQLKVGLKCAKGALKAFKSGENNEMISIAIELAKDTVNDIFHGQIKMTLLYILQWAQQIIKVIISGDKNQFVSLAIDIAEDAVKKFADGQTLMTLQFCMKWAKEASDAIKNGKTFDLFSA